MAEVYSKLDNIENEVADRVNKEQKSFFVFYLLYLEDARELILSSHNKNGNRFEYAN